MTEFTSNATDLALLRETGQADELLRLERLAMRIVTRHDHGDMIWRQWGGDGPLVVLFHGGSGSWNHWLRTIPALMPNYTVIAPDLPGFGESASPPKSLAVDDYCAIVADGLDRVLLARAAFDLVTFSLGGEFAVPVAKLLPDRLRRLVMVGSNIFAPVTRDRVPMRDYRKVSDASERNAIIYDNFVKVMLHDPSRIDPLALAMQHENLARRRLGSSVFKDRRPLCEVIRELPASTSLDLINGENDVILWGHVKEQQAALARIRPQGTLRIIPGGSHWVMYDRADAFNNQLRQLLA